MKFLASQATSILRTRLRNQEYKCNSPIHFKTLLQSMHTHPSVKRKSFFLEHGFRWRLIFYVLYRWCIELYTVRRGAVRRHPTVKTRCNFIDFSTQTSTPSIWQPRSSLAFEWSSASSLCNFWRRFNFGKSKADYEWLPCSATVKLTWKCSGFAWSLTFWKSNPNYLLKNRNHSKYLAPC